MPPTKPKNLAVIGDPIAHSLSPQIQNAALKQAGLKLKYQAVRVGLLSLKSFVKGAEKSYLGFNVTIPHKVAILPLMDRLAFEAKAIGAVNTVLIKDGQLVGFNTDGAGYLMSLQNDAGFRPRGKHVTLLGAGGAARAIAMALGLDRVKSLSIANRTLDHAKDLVRDLKKRLPQLAINACPLDGKDFEAALKRTDLLVNTTSVGLGGTRFPDFPWFSLKNRAVVSDIVYRPLHTHFLKTAKKAGHAIHSGEGMLIYQGALAFEIWTGVKPDTALMRRVMLKELKKIEESS